MWRKLILLLFYLIAEIVMLQLWEWYNFDLLRRPYWIKPHALNARSLKALLLKRGILHGDVFEKSTLTDLVTQSGRVTALDVSDALPTAEPHMQPFDKLSRVVANSFNHLTFTGLEHFNELVEDSKDSAWLVHVVSSQGASAIDINLWHQLIAAFEPFGVRFGLYDCRNDARLVMVVT